MLRAIPGPLLTEWMAHLRRPTEPERLLATLCALTYNAHRGAKDTPLTADHYLPRHVRRAGKGRGRAKSKAEMPEVAQRLKAWALAVKKGRS